MAETQGKRDAQQRANRIRSFRQELDQLSREQVLALTEEQRTRLDAHLDKTLQELAGRYDVDVSESQKQLSIGMRIASALGGLALCAAVFLFFYRFWGLIPTGGQVVILVITPLAGLVAMDLVARRERTLYFTSLIGLVVFASFVMNLYVLGQIFNIASSPKAFLAWGLFALVLAYAYGLRLPLAGGLLSLLVFLAATVVGWTGVWWQSVESRPELGLIGGLLMLAAPAAIRHAKREEFPWVYRMVGLLVIFFSIVILWHSGGDSESYLPLSSKATERLYQWVGFVAAGATIWWGVRRSWQGIVNLGCAVFTIFLFIKLVDWWWDWIPKYLFFLIVGLIAIGLLFAFRRLRARMA